MRSRIDTRGRIDRCVFSKAFDTMSMVAFSIAMHHQYIFLSLSLGLLDGRSDLIYSVDCT